MEDAYYFNADDSRFMNHDEHPSLMAQQEGRLYVASRDIQANEELTCDYRDFAIQGDSCFDF